MSSEPVLMEVGTVFDTLQELKIAVKQFALSNNFETRTLKADQYRYRLKWKTEGWLLLARPIEQSLLWVVKEFDDTHTCFPLNHGGNSSASAQFLATKILEQVCTQPDIRPINIQKDLHAMYGLTVPYSRVH